MNEKRARCDRKGPPEEPKASRLGSPLPTSNSGADVVVHAEDTRLEKIEPINDSHQGGAQNGCKAGAEFFGGRERVWWLFCFSAKMEGIRNVQRPRYTRQ